MDPIISKLNEVIQKRVQNIPTTGPVPLERDQPSSFQSKFDAKMAERLMDNVRESYGATEQNQMKVLSVEDIHVQTKGEVQPSRDADFSEKFFSMFKEMNKDLLSLDSAIETLTTPGIKLSPRQLLAMQAGIANTTILAEGFSRFTDSIARGIQTIVNTQLG